MFVGALLAGSGSAIGGPAMLSNSPCTELTRLVTVVPGAARTLAVNKSALSVPAAQPGTRHTTSFPSSTPPSVADTNSSLVGSSVSRTTTVLGTKTAILGR